MAQELRNRVLVVDDEASIRTLVCKTLADTCEVTATSDGPEALAALARSSFDVVVLDIMMPGMSGLDVCREIRARLPESPRILLLTALDDQENRWAGLEAGADDYLAKPFDRRELQLRVAHFAQLAQQQRVIREQLQAMRELVNLRDDLTALVVHDLRNPLTGVQVAFQTLLRDPKVPADARELLQLGATSATHVMEATSDLLKLRLLEANKLPINKAPVDLALLAGAAVETVKLSAHDRGVPIELTTMPGVIAPVDEKLVRRALENLIANAVRHTRGTVEVGLGVAGGKAIISVADRGGGVPDELKEGLFEKFGSVALLKKGARRGHGLGLYMVRLVAQAHDGSVDVDDREGGGASFRLLVPLTEGVARPQP